MLDQARELLFGFTAASSKKANKMKAQQKQQGATSLQSPAPPRPKVKKQKLRALEGAREERAADLLRTAPVASNGANSSSSSGYQSLLACEGQPSGQVRAPLMTGESINQDYANKLEDNSSHYVSADELLRLKHAQFHHLRGANPASVAASSALGAARPAQRKQLLDAGQHATMMTPSHDNIGLRRRATQRARLPPMVPIMIDDDDDDNNQEAREEDDDDDDDDSKDEFAANGHHHLHQYQADFCQFQAAACSPSALEFAHNVVDAVEGELDHGRLIDCHLQRQQQQQQQHLSWHRRQAQSLAGEARQLHYELQHQRQQPPRPHQSSTLVKADECLSPLELPLDRASQLEFLQQRRASNRSYASTKRMLIAAGQLNNQPQLYKQRPFDFGDGQQQDLSCSLISFAHLQQPQQQQQQQQVFYQTSFEPSNQEVFASHAQLLDFQRHQQAGSLAASERAQQEQQQQQLEQEAERCARAAGVMQASKQHHQNHHSPYHHQQQQQQQQVKRSKSAQQQQAYEGHQLHANNFKLQQAAGHRQPPKSPGSMRGAQAARRATGPEATAVAPGSRGIQQQLALNCYGRLAKFLLFLTNAIFWSTGIALGAWGILALVEDHKYNLSQLLVFEPSARMSLFQLLSWSFITLGCATILVGFCGCSAMFKNNRWILGLYIFLILTIFALDLATGLLAMIFQERLVANVRLRLVGKLKNEYGIQASFTAAIDYIQTRYECCGLEGHFDYDQSLWRLQRLGGFEATVARTCCHLRNTFDDQAHVNPRPLNESMCQSTDVRFHQSYRYRRGCLDDLERLIRQKIWTFTIGCGAVGAVILLSLLFATCFCRSIPASNGQRRAGSGGNKSHSSGQLAEQQIASLSYLVEAANNGNQIGAKPKQGHAVPHYR